MKMMELCKIIVIKGNSANFFCCCRNYAKFFVEGIVQDLVTEGIVQSLVRDEGQRMHLFISVFLGSLNVGKLEIVHSFLSFFLFPPPENQKKTETIGESRCGLLRREVWLMAGTMGIMW
jgi:hypothetical protein